jgi:hypothetical protein
MLPNPYQVGSEDSDVQTGLPPFGQPVARFGGATAGVVAYRTGLWLSAPIAALRSTDASRNPIPLWGASLPRRFLGTGHEY